jgi:thioesterase domain-containing protein
MSMTPNDLASAVPDTALAPPTAAASADAVRALEAQLQAMPPVAALGLRVQAYDGAQLRLWAPLAANVNDKGCAFGGSLASVMTLAGWGLIAARLDEAGFEADVYVADSEVRYKAPLYADLSASAEAAEGASWPAFFATLGSRGKARLEVVARVLGPEGGIASESRSRYVAVRRARTE